ncbi:MAG TPA: FlgO family outer membrane protein [Candidatus Acidoferrum sp.]|nr:FlgO family outer membrane protein [Candidatus Acidoferrum sp.]
MTPQRLYRFGPFVLDAQERVLLREGQPVILPPKDLEMLLVLVERAGHILEKEELLQKVWPGVFVEEGNLSRRIFNLRQVLGDTEDGRNYIETVPKRGYRFVAALQDNPPPPASAPAPSVELRRPSPPEAPAKRFWLWPLLLSVLLALVAVLVSRYFWPLRPVPREKLMLAVMPFANLSGVESEDYFAEGLTEEMTAQLSELEPARLGVIARTSTLRFRSTSESAQQIGKELGVGYLLVGSVRRGGDRVRVTAQLIQTADQSDIWAGSYERPLTDVLEIQREIAEKITDSLSIQLLPGDSLNPPGARLDFQSYDKYLLGQHLLGEGTRESVNKAIDYFQDALARNPNDARTYEALAEAYNASLTYYSSPKEVMPRAKAAAERALQLDPKLASAHVTLGNVHLLFDWDWPAALEEYQRALQINPNSPEAQLGYANYLATLGHFDEAITRVQRAYLFDPLALESRNEALWIYYFSGRMPETIAQARKTIEIEPQAGLPYAILAMSYAQLGDRKEVLAAAANAVDFANSPSILTTTASALAQIGERAQARQILDKALAQAKDRYVCRFLVATAYVEMGDKEKALESLNDGFLQRSA